MNRKRLTKAMGCLLLAGCIAASPPQSVYASGGGSHFWGEKEQETHSKETEAVPKDTESDTEAETQTESQTELHTETLQGTESERQTESHSELETVKESEAPSESGSETETQSEEKEEPISILDGKESEKELKVIDKPKKEQEKEQEDHSDANADLEANIIAGNGIYLEELLNTYGLAFEDGFSEVMDEIEEDFSGWLEKPEEFHAKNWQDVLAVYVLRKRSETGSSQITLGKSSKEELEKIFFLMNIRRDSSIAKKLSKEVDLDAEICELTVTDYAQLTNLGEEEKELLKKYTDTSCRKLCAVVTASKGFVRSEVGNGVSEERVSIVAAACSLVGKVGYFWGGKSYAVGWDSLWGKPMTVTADGSRSTGMERGYGLDCSGFVCWSYYNGLGGTDGGIGNHTTDQWNASEMIDCAQAKPGDLVFYDSAEAGDQNHVGLVIGKNEDGSLLVAHCSSSQNGVVVGEAWSSGFKYVRKPIAFE